MRMVTTSLIARVRAKNLSLRIRNRTVMLQFSPDFLENSAINVLHDIDFLSFPSRDRHPVSLENIDLSSYVRNYDSMLFLISGLPDGAYLINEAGEYCEIQSGKFLDAGKMKDYQVLVPNTVRTFEFDIIISEIISDKEIELTTITFHVDTV